MDPLNRKVSELDKILRTAMQAFRDRVARIPYHGMNIPRVFSDVDDDQDDAPYSFVGARLHPRHPSGGSAVALPEPDEELHTTVSARKV